MKIKQPGSLTDGVVHVWHGDVSVFKSQQAVWAKWLSPDAKARAIRLPADARQQFILSRGLLRACLAQYLNQPAEALVFERNAAGKPNLPAHPLHFSLSHSSSQLVIAVRRDAPIGVDIERLVGADQHPRIVERLFGSLERDYLSEAVDSQDWQQRFYRCWTRKEAVLKACGASLWQLRDVLPLMPIQQRGQVYRFFEQRLDVVDMKIDEGCLALASPVCWAEWVGFTF